MVYFGSKVMFHSRAIVIHNLTKMAGMTKVGFEIWIDFFEKQYNTRGKILNKNQITNLFIFLLSYMFPMQWSFQDLLQAISDSASTLDLKFEMKLLQKIF